MYSTNHIVFFLLSEVIFSFSACFLALGFSLALALALTLALALALALALNLTSNHHQYQTLKTRTTKKSNYVKSKPKNGQEDFGREFVLLSLFDESCPPKQ
jgi:hypothetical protein